VTHAQMCICAAVTLSPSRRDLRLAHLMASSQGALNTLSAAIDGGNSNNGATIGTYCIGMEATAAVYLVQGAASLSHRTNKYRHTRKSPCTGEPRRGEEGIPFPFFSPFRLEQRWEQTQPTNYILAYIPLWYALCTTVQYITIQYSTVQYSTEQYSTVQYSTVHCSTVQNCTTVECSAETGTDPRPPSSSSSARCGTPRHSAPPLPADSWTSSPC